MPIYHKLKTISITFSEFFQSIDWSPLEKMEIMKFRAPSSSGWEIAKYGEQYEATYRSAFSPDSPDYIAFTIDEMARWLFSRQAYQDVSTWPLCEPGEGE